MHTLLMLTFVLLLSFLALVNGDCQVDPSFPGFNPNVYMFSTSDSVTGVDIDQVKPPIENPPDADIYLSSTSCLGYLGPIGCYGPLGSLGPIGTSSFLSLSFHPLLGSNAWSPSYWISGSGLDWTNFSQTITGMGGPLSAQGPLGSSGPLNSQAYFQWMPCINDFAANLAAGGLWTVLGPLGPFGPAGALGPLGPIGATGYTRDSNGQFVDSNGNVVRSISVPWDSSTNRTWDLFEFYTQQFASKFTSNDCSFLVEGIVGSNGKEGDTYTFTSSVSQYVTILLVPLKQLDDWTLIVKNGKHTIATVGPDLFVNWVQIRVPANTQLTAEIQLGSTWQPLPSDYRLYVSGSTDLINGTDITGPHLKKYTPV